MSGYDGADRDDPTTPARIIFNDALAGLIADAIQAGVTVTALGADCDAQLSLHADTRAAQFARYREMARADIATWGPPTEAEKAAVKRILNPDPLPRPDRRA